MKIKIVTMVLLLVFVGRANALVVADDLLSEANYLVIAEDLLSDCESESTVVCPAYLLGFFESMISFEFPGKPKGVFCPPGFISGKQLTKIYIKHANENPGSLHLPAAVFAMHAFLTAFPCE